MNVDWLCNSIVWSLAGFALGCVVGYLVRASHDTPTEAPLTTPERLRRRQRRESVAVAVLAFALVGSSVYFQASDNRQRDCIRAVIASQTDTQKIRSGLVEQESEATRKVISSALSAESRDAIQLAREEYARALARIDRVRRDNPVQNISPKVCGDE